MIIPAFAIGRVEELLYWLFKPSKTKAAPPKLPIYVDSPMAIKAHAITTARARDELDKEILADAPQASAFATARFDPSSRRRNPRRWSRATRPAGDLSASSGMATGGRVVHHLSAGLPDPRNTVLFVGFQAAGTRGRQLVDGATST